MSYASTKLRRRARFDPQRVTTTGEIARLQQLVETQAQQLGALSAQIARMAAQEQDLRELLLEAHDQLLRRDEEIVMTLAAAVQQRGATTTTTTPAPMAGSRPRTYLSYQQLIQRVRDIARANLPAQATTIIVSKGDNELLKLDGRPAWHFPQLDNGVYAGHYPADSAAAIAHLEALRAKGGAFLIFPQTAFWWLDHYTEFKQHLESQYRLVVQAADVCLIFELDQAAGAQVKQIDQSEEPLSSHTAQAMVQDSLPSETTVIVVGNDDRGMPPLGQRTIWRFPQAADGRFTGAYPADSVELINQLEALRARGASHLVVPSRARWCLAYYRDFQQHLATQYRRTWHDERCSVYDLTERQRTDRAG
jgi:hypothetical protein